MENYSEARTYCTLALVDRQLEVGAHRLFIMADVFKREDVEKLFAKGASDEWGEMREGRTILMVIMYYVCIHTLSSVLNNSPG